jgi:hypothetical protein
MSVFLGVVNLVSKRISSPGVPSLVKTKPGGCVFFTLSCVMTTGHATMRIHCTVSCVCPFYPPNS